MNCLQCNKEYIEKTHGLFCSNKCYEQNIDYAKKILQSWSAGIITKIIKDKIKNNKGDNRG